MINNINYRFNNNKIININECKKLLKLNIKKLIGYGGQGSVFKLMSDKCGIGVIKIFHSKTNKKKMVQERKYQFRAEKIVCIRHQWCTDVNIDLGETIKRRV